MAENNRRGRRPFLINLTSDEIDMACSLRQQGFSIPEIGRKFNIPRGVARKIIVANLENHESYEYIPPKKREGIEGKSRRERERVKRERELALKKHEIRNHSLTLQAARTHMIQNPVIQLFHSILNDIKQEHANNIPLSKLSSLLLNNEDHILKRIAEFCDFLVKMNIHRTEKTILAVIIALDFPKVFRTAISRLIGVTPVTIRKNLKLLKEISMQKKNALDKVHPFRHLGRLLEEQETNVSCFNCGHFIHVRLYQDDKKIFVCNHCLRQE